MSNYSWGKGTSSVGAGGVIWNVGWVLLRWDKGCVPVGRREISRVACLTDTAPPLHAENTGTCTTGRRVPEGQRTCLFLSLHFAVTEERSENAAVEVVEDRYEKGLVKLERRRKLQHVGATAAHREVRRRQSSGSPQSRHITSVDATFSHGLTQDSVWVLMWIGGFGAHLSAQ